jgi:glutamate dehydrogenase
MLFDENYGLASTQSLKNKDIPEGGAKGTILPSYVVRVRSCDGSKVTSLSSIGASPRLCFEKYVDVSHINLSWRVSNESL